MKLINYILLLLCLNACSGQPEQSGYTEMKTPTSVKNTDDYRAMRRNMDRTHLAQWEIDFLDKWENQSVPLGKLVNIPNQGIKRIEIYAVNMSIIRDPPINDVETVIEVVVKDTRRGLEYQYPDDPKKLQQLAPYFSIHPTDLGRFSTMLQQIKTVPLDKYPYPYPDMRLSIEIEYENQDIIKILAEEYPHENILPIMIKKTRKQPVYAVIDMGDIDEIVAHLDPDVVIFPKGRKPLRFEFNHQ